ncbi:hypothetical protein SAMN06295888_1385 [Desulfonatronum zhilinae]|nr:hypothetical protein SAMN06295888_1385 [Desulfonatronum zhilinae]
MNTILREDYTLFVFESSDECIDCWEDNKNAFAYYSFILHSLDKSLELLDTLRDRCKMPIPEGCYNVIIKFNERPVNMLEIARSISCGGYTHNAEPVSDLYKSCLILSEKSMHS